MLSIGLNNSLGILRTVCTVYLPYILYIYRMFTVCIVHTVHELSVLYVPYVLYLVHWGQHVWNGDKLITLFVFVSKHHFLNDIV